MVLIRMSAGADCTTCRASRRLMPSRWYGEMGQLLLRLRGRLPAPAGCALRVPAVGEAELARDRLFFLPSFGHAVLATRRDAGEEHVVLEALRLDAAALGHRDRRPQPRADVGLHLGAPLLLLVGEQLLHPLLQAEVLDDLGEHVGGVGVGALGPIEHGADEAAPPMVEEARGVAILVLAPRQVVRLAPCLAREGHAPPPPNLALVLPPVLDGLVLGVRPIAPLGRLGLGRGRRLDALLLAVPPDRLSGLLLLLQSSSQHRRWLGHGRSPCRVGLALGTRQCLLGALGAKLGGALPRQQLLRRNQHRGGGAWWRR
mmetsp:Transcript_2471/g.7581  ORF Transcript_2471/g.7581 Transcript_2471/m.7581 type:complete len:315 (+) Transcript_2471:289-1233(+)